MEHYERGDILMRRNRWRRIWRIGLGLAIVMLVLVSCGRAKGVADAVSDVERIVKQLESYHAEGTMVLNTGQQPQQYGVVVSFQKPDFYRIALTNETKDITQIVLRNEEGVFVLTPHLQKSFRFQSDWPKNQGQAYLYETLAQSILSDDQRQFAIEDKAYVFDVLANYQNASLVRQKIWLNKDSMAPQRVLITDADEHEMVTVTFQNFEFNKKFDAEWFNMQRNMTSLSIQSIPFMNDEEEMQAEGGDRQEGIIYPAYEPAGISRSQPKAIKMGERDAIMLRYAGAYHYTLVQAKALEERMVVSSMGTVVDIDLGETVGVLIGEEQRTLLWTAEGVDYRLSSGDLPYEEMVRVARSVFGQVGK